MGPGQGLLFAAYSFAHGRELWTLAPGGASPATLAWDVLPGGASSEPSELTTLAASVTGGAPAWLFAARAADGAAPTLHAWSAGANGLRCALALSTPVTSPLRPVVAAAGTFFVGTAAGAGAPSLWLLPRSALTASALCAQGAPLPVSQPLPGVAPVSRVEHCGGKVVFLARGVGARPPRPRRGRKVRFGPVPGVWRPSLPHPR
jgi:ELWxxDGT repeat protein